MVELPNEIWMQIFELALHDEQLIGHVLPDSTTPCSWFRMIYGNWALRTPSEQLIVAYGQRYSLLKTVTLTCRNWRQLISEFMFEALCFNDLNHFNQFFALLERDPTVWKWVRRISIMPFLHANRWDTSETLNTLASILQRCRRIEVLAADFPLKASFSPLADVLCTRARGLRTLRLNVSAKYIKKVILILESLSSLSYLHLEIAGSTSDDVKLGAVSGMALSFPRLRQLCLHGLIADLVEEACAWDFPSLEMVSLDFLHHHDLPDLQEFLRSHGALLTFLDIDSTSSMDVASILELCPNLQAFAFNLDWRLPSTVSGAAALVNSPHPNLTFIGCHGLAYAFGVGYLATAAAYDPFTTRYMRHSNDMNILALNTRNFPKLKYVRVLSRSLLRDLEAANGPHSTCYDRWARWSNQCAREGIRLEDCTGDELGALPDDGEDYDEFLEEEEEEYEYVEEAVEEALDPISILRRLREECQQAVANLQVASPAPFYDQAWM
ncbi:unnamed protein product [Somion occarium]|uniref:F-box domain-containing protein n=1 Tax=Somion occarium TaxID=3059160 RepID=A0ABP1CI85_9APHY